MPEEVIMMPYDCQVGEVISLSIGDELVVRGRITEVVQAGSIYKIVVEDSALQAALRRRRRGD